MIDPSTPAGRPKRRSPWGLAAAAAGIALFVYFVERTGVADIAAGAGRLGWVFLAVVALGGLRLGARALAWRGCLDGPHRLTGRDAFCAMVAGDTLGNLTPLGLLVSEPAKTLFAGDREPPSRTLPALAVENLFFTLSAALVVAGGAMALVLRLGATDRWWIVGAALVGALVLLVAAVHGVIWRRLRFASGLLAGVARHGPAGDTLRGWAERVRRVEDRVYDLYPRAPRRLAAVAGWELGFHALAVFEIYLVLGFVSDVTPTPLDAFVLESTNRLLTAAFKVVPLRIGVDEAGTAAVAELLAFGGAAGVTLAIVRKARMLVWMTAGVLLLVRRGLPARGDAAREETEPAGDGADAPEPRGAAIVVMARSPSGARAPKTRLAGVLPSELDRRQLYTAFLTDVVSACRVVEGATLRVAYTPDGGPHGFAPAGIADRELMPQRGANLGDRERGVFEDLFRDGFSPVVLIGSDLPGLPAERIGEALGRLAARRDTVVLGPTADGGYYLIGLVRPRAGDPVPELFMDIRWSTAWTRADTVAAAERCGLQVGLLDPWRDVDDADDLARLRAALAGGGAGRAPATAARLRELAARTPGVIPRGGPPSP